MTNETLKRQLIAESDATYPPGGVPPLTPEREAFFANLADTLEAEEIANSTRTQAQQVDAAFAEPVVIRPTVGRIVWYWPHGRDRNASIVDLSPVGRASQPMAATVCYVHGDRLVNLLVTDHVGRQHTRPEVQLVQEGDIHLRPAYGVAAYAAWMPYQTGQAKRERAAVAPAQGQA